MTLREATSFGRMSIIIAMSLPLLTLLIVLDNAPLYVPKVHSSPGICITLNTENGPESCDEYQEDSNFLQLQTACKSVLDGEGKFIIKRSWSSTGKCIRANVIGVCKISSLKITRVFYPRKDNKILQEICEYSSAGSWTPTN